MKIGIDISRSVDEATGVGCYAKHLVRGLAEIDRENEYLLYGMFCHCYPGKWKQAEVPQAANFRLHQKGYPTGYVMRRWASFERYGEEVLGGVDVVHSTAYTMPPVKRAAVVVTIHDLSFFVYPEHHTDANYQFVTRNVHLAARRADYIIVDSESTRSDVRRYLHVPEGRLGVVHLAAGESYYEKASDASIARVRQKYSITKPYFLAVGSIEPRKNLSNTLRAFAALVRSGKSGHQLVLAGGRGWKNEKLYELVEELRIGPHLVFTGYVSESELPVLYQGADVFVYPSLYEGFGLPVLEAMASGVPVITSNVSSLPEVAGDAALLVDPLNVPELASAMAALVTKQALHAELRDKGLRRGREFSWKKTAAETLGVYTRVYRARAGRGDQHADAPGLPMAQAEGSLLRE